MYLFIYLCHNLSVYTLTVYLSVFLSSCLFICLTAYLHIFWCTYLSVFTFVYPPIHLSNCIFVSLYVYLSISFVCLSVSLSFFHSVYISDYLSFLSDIIKEQMYIFVQNWHWVHVSNYLFYSYTGTHTGLWLINRYVSHHWVMLNPTQYYLTDKAVLYITMFK